MCLIQLHQVGLSYPHKICFSEFSAQIAWGQRIAIVGDNGVGKSSLLSLLRGNLPPSEGLITRTPNLAIGHVEQLHEREEHRGLSGGQRVNKAINQALSDANEILLLDEPTNHLDRDNRRSLTRMLAHFHGSIVLVTHDDSLMDQVCDTIWHIAEQRVHVFSGRYRDFLAQRQRDFDKLEKKLIQLKRAQGSAHQELMKEQERAAHAKQRGATSIAQRRWPTIKSPTKLGRGSTTAVSKQAEIRQQRNAVTQQLAEIPRYGKIEPRFHFLHQRGADSNVLQITNGSIRYATGQPPIAHSINLHISSGDRWAVTGKNGSGKSTLARAILNDANIVRGGDWHTPNKIGYLDQHYQNLQPELSVMDILASQVPDWPEVALRRHLVDFLFRGDEIVHAPAKSLSGGEKARLSLACIAAQIPHLLILDELTNNLDRTVRQHVIEVLKNYPGTMLLISHDEDLLEQIGDIQYYALSTPQ